MSRVCNDSPAQYLQLNSPIVTVAPFSVSVWAMTTNDADDFQTILGVGQSGTDHFWRLRLRHVAGRVEWAVEDTSSLGRADTTAVPAQDTWFHVGAAEEASNSRKILLNGGNKGTNTTTVVPSSVDTTWIGQLDDGSPSDRFIGPIAHIAFWNAGLTDEEFQVLATGIPPFQVRPDNFLRMIPLNGRDPEPVIPGPDTFTLFGSPLVGPEPPIYRPILAPA
jgi:hypothetical protein